jgi:hypothetical protein
LFFIRFIRRMGRAPFEAVACLALGGIVAGALAGLIEGYAHQALPPPVGAGIAIAWASLCIGVWFFDGYRSRSGGVGPGPQAKPRD